MNRPLLVESEVIGEPKRKLRRVGEMNIIVEHHGKGWLYDKTPYNHYNKAGARNIVNE
jgi:hypothetical protein